MQHHSRTRRLRALALAAVVVLALAACAPITPTPVVGEGTPVAPGATAVSTAAATQAPVAGTPVTGATPAGPARFAGTVKHAGRPAAGARVQLRPLGWATSMAPAAATIQADDQGNFNLTNPPLGEFSVLGFFADGEMDAGGWPPVTIQAGQQVVGFIVPIERKLTLLSPIAGSAAPMPLVLKWKPSAEAVAYRVWVIDAGTTEAKLDVTTKDTTLAGPEGLRAGEYQWVVNGLDAAGELVATGQETFTVQGSGEPTATPAPSEADGLPPSCQPHAGATAVYSDRQRGFCFLYPAKFEKNPFDPGQINVVGVVAGPALDTSADPVRATLLIEAVQADTTDLPAAVKEITQEFAGQPGIKITQQPMDLGGVAAVLLQGVPGRGGSHDVVVLQNGLRFRLIFMPDPQQGFPQAAQDFQALFDAVTQSFTFMPAQVTESQGPGLKPGMPRLPDDERAFAGARAALAKKLSIDELTITRIDQQPQEWSDACLGLAGADEACAQMITPGWTIVLEAGGKRYEAHTDQEGRHVRFVGLK